MYNSTDFDRELLHECILSIEIESGCLPRSKKKSLKDVLLFHKFKLPHLPMCIFWKLHINVKDFGSISANNF